MLDVGSISTTAEPAETSSSRHADASIRPGAFRLPKIFHDSLAASSTAELAISNWPGTWFDGDFTGSFHHAAARAQLSAVKAGSFARTRSALMPAAYLVADEDQFLDDIATALAHVVDAKSHSTSSHSQRVATYADSIAQELGLDGSHRRWLKRAALLHDIGKLGVSNEILHKPGELDASERAAMRQHAALSERILSRIGAFQDLARVVGAHHERLDGQGYPNGLSGDDITLETRIISIADVFDALTTERPYRAALPVGAAQMIMADDVGAALDARCFDALMAALRKS